MRGEFAEAEAAYREASRSGREPQPGLALLRIAQGRPGGGRRDPARQRRSRRACRAIGAPARRGRDHARGGGGRAAREAYGQLVGVANGFESELLDAIVQQAEGALELAEGEPRSALVPLRRSLQTFQALGVPYEIARVRVLTALACRTLGDEDGALLDLEAARDAFEELGAAPDVARTRSPAAASPDDAHGLTARELEVLRLVAAGETNKAIAARLVLSERTVERHEQHPREGRGLLAGGRHGLRVRAPARRVSVETPTSPRGQRRGSADAGAPRRRDSEPMSTKTIHSGGRERLTEDLPVSERQLMLAGVSTAVLEGGEGPPVVLLHGPSANATHWTRVLPGLARGHRVIAPDLPGRRASEPVDGRHGSAALIAWLGQLIERTCESPPSSSVTPRRRHRSSLRRRRRRSHPRAGAGRYARPRPVRPGAGLRGRAAGVCGGAERAHARSPLAALRPRPGAPA